MADGASMDAGGSARGERSRPEFNSPTMTRTRARVAKNGRANYDRVVVVYQGVMSTRTVIWVVFVGVLVAALATFFVYRSYVLAGGSTKASGDARPTVIAQQNGFEAVIAEDGSSWPQFGADPSRSGQVGWSVPESMERVWRFKTGAEVKSSAAIVGGRVFIGSSDANVYALDLRTGGKIWAYTTKGAVEASPTVVGARVYVGSTDGWVYALDANDGGLKWKFKTGAEIHGAANWVQAAGEGTRILVGSYDSKVYCLDSQKGEPVWTYETGSYINGSPAVADGLCAFGGCDAMIHVVSLADGTKRSEIETGSYIAASAAFVNGQIYVGNYDNVFLRADVASGQVAWKYADSNAPFFSSPAVTGEMVVVGGRDGLVHAIGRDDGKRRWAFRTQGEVDSSPAVCGDRVIVGSADGRLYMLRLSDGQKLWSYDLGRAVASSPAVAQGVVVVGCDDGWVYAFGTRRAGGTLR
jgi:outer membrane protein assembly factor BamB